LCARSKRQTFERGERDKDRSREDDARRAAVRGIARVLQARFASKQILWQSALDMGVWPPSILTPVAPFPETDQLSLAANLSSEEWAEIVSAESALGQVQPQAQAGRGRRASDEVR
jgi:hypothetical protein